MKNYVRNLRRIIGDEVNTDSEKGFFTPVGSYTVPNFLHKQQQDVYPKIVLRPFINFLPVAKGMKDENTRFKLFEGKVQVDIFTKDEVELIEICEAVNDRIYEFFNVQIKEFKDPYDWEAYEGNESVFVNPEYDDESDIIKAGDLEKVDSIDSVINTSNSWYLDSSGLYINGDYANSILTKKLTGKVFPDGDTVQEKGFAGCNDVTPMRELPGEEYDTEMFSLDYEIFYEILKPVGNAGTVEEVNISGERK